ncbi:MAG: hypothetical protein K2J78_11895 [Muribaculaceae bacterium]|nr:hypothetical protein [Muribaculaceae bacterium]
MMLPLTAFAEKEKVVSGSYTYYIPYNVARDKAEQIAMERAIIQAMADCLHSAYAHGYALL